MGSSFFALGSGPRPSASRDKPYEAQSMALGSFGGAGAAAAGGAPPRADLGGAGLAGAAAVSFLARSARWAGVSGAAFSWATSFFKAASSCS
eukprot:scaffold107305_cov63-Phaeocystis_antarctica.AAC.1